MAVTTWSFGSGYESWTFNDNSSNPFPGKNACPTCSDTRSHVSGAIRHTMIVSSLANVCGWGQHSSPTLNATIQNGDTIEMDFSATSDGKNEGRFVEAFYTDATSETASTLNQSAPSTTTLTLTQNKTLDYIQIDNVRCTSGSASGTTHSSDLLEVRLTTATPFTGTGQKPLGLDIDLENGGKIYVTSWDGDLGGDLLLKEYNSAIALQNTYTIASNSANIIDIGNRTFFLSPYTPPFFGTASLDDIIYIYGRWDDAAVIRHVSKSIDGGASFSDIGDSATWLTGWVGAFFADDANTLYAFVNGGSPALYRSLNAGTSWTNLSTLPFDVDPHGVSKHPDGRILIANRINGAQMAAYADSAYSSWTNATGSPSFPTGGSGARAMAWVV